MLTNQSGSIVFGMMVCHETPELVARCLQDLRASYPESPVIVFLDGKEPTGELYNAIKPHAFAVCGDRLKKGVKNGAAIWARFFEFALQCGTDFIVKLDPDTRVHRRLTLFPIAGPYSAGRLMSKGYDAQHVQGGFQLFTRKFAQAALVESQSPIYCNPESWKCGQSDVFTSRDLVSTDYLLRVITKAIGGIMIDHPEMDCRSVLGSTPFRPDAAVTHPHKKPND